MGDPGSNADPTQIGRYLVEGQLGAGGVGVVFAAHDPRLGRKVAVKLLRSDRLGADPARAGQRLREEAQAMARLAHPNVVTVYDVGEHEGGVYIAMELVEGQSLRDWLKVMARPWREVLNAYFQAGRGLAAAHEAGLVHRDFKPANILVGVDGRVRVVDFGLASSGPMDLASTDLDELEGHASTSGVYHRSSQLTDIETTIDESGLPPEGGPLTTGVITPRQGRADISGTFTAVDMTVEGTLHPTALGADPHTTIPTGLTHSGLVAGTPAYMAPELFLGRTADARSDQFAFAVSLFEGLYGERPFAGSNTAEIADAVMNGRIRTPPSSHGVPRWVHRIVEQGLQTRRQDRHPSIRSMLASFAFLARVVWN